MGGGVGGRVVVRHGRAWRRGHVWWPLSPTLRGRAQLSVVGGDGRRRPRVGPPSPGGRRVVVRWGGVRASFPELSAALHFATVVVASCLVACAIPLDPDSIDRHLAYVIMRRTFSSVPRPRTKPCCWAGAQSGSLLAIGLFNTVIRILALVSINARGRVAPACRRRIPVFSSSVSEVPFGKKTAMASQKRGGYAPVEAATASVRRSTAAASWPPALQAE